MASITPGKTTSEIIVVGQGAISIQATGISAKYSAQAAGKCETGSAETIKAASTSLSLQQVYCRVLTRVVARISAREIQAERKAIEIGGDLVEACHIAVAAQSADHELGVSIQLFDQIECSFCIAVLAIG